MELINKSIQYWISDESETRQPADLVKNISEDTNNDIAKPKVKNSNRSTAAAEDYQNNDTYNQACPGFLWFVDRRDRCFKL